MGRHHYGCKLRTTYSHTALQVHIAYNSVSPHIFKRVLPPAFNFSNTRAVMPSLDASSDDEEETAPETSEWGMKTQGTSVP